MGLHPSHLALILECWVENFMSKPPSLGTASVQTLPKKAQKWWDYPWRVKTTPTVYLSWPPENKHVVYPFRGACLEALLSINPVFFSNFVWFGLIWIISLMENLRWLKKNLIFGGPTKMCCFSHCPRVAGWNMPFSLIVSTRLRIALSAWVPPFQVHVHRAQGPFACSVVCENHGLCQAPNPTRGKAVLQLIQMLTQLYRSNKSNMPQRNIANILATN